MKCNDLGAQTFVSISVSVNFDQPMIKDSPSASAPSSSSVRPLSVLVVAYYLAQLLAAAPPRDVM